VKEYSTPGETVRALDVCMKRARRELRGVYVRGVRNEAHERVCVVEKCVEATMYKRPHADAER
jgi:hypothetical protein